MTQPLPPLRLTGADILRDGVMQRRSVALADGKITRGPFPEVDLTGYLILPGIIDLHGRPGTRPTADSLVAADRAAAANGLTTAHLTQHWSWEGGPHGPDQAEALMQALDDYRPHALTDLRLAIQAEVHLVDQGPRLIAALARHGVGYVVFSDLLEAAVTRHRLTPQVFAQWAHSLEQDTPTLRAAMDRVQRQKPEVPRHLCRLAEAFDAMGIVYGSHRDPDGETRELYAMIGARVAEFPATRRAAAAAHAMMSPVILSAADVPGCADRPGTAARDLITQGLGDALASDNDPASLAAAAWSLVDGGIAPLPRAWAMISTIPAQILRLPDRGTLSPGQRADLVVVNAATRRIEATICAGRLIHLAGGAAQRFPAQSLLMAAE